MIFDQWRKKRERGFTLVELLVVILIIGILLAVALPTFLGQEKGAQDTAAKEYLSSAYKNAKADAVANPAGPGNYYEAHVVASKLADEAPELTPVKVAGHLGDISDLETLYIISNGTPGGNGDFQAGYESASGKLCSLTVVDNGGVDLHCN